VFDDEELDITGWQTGAWVSNASLGSFLLTHYNPT